MKPEQYSELAEQFSEGKITEDQFRTLLVEAGIAAQVVVKFVDLENGSIESDSIKFIVDAEGNIRDVDY